MKTVCHLAPVLIVLLGLPRLSIAQTNVASSTAVSTSLKTLHEITARNITRTAEMLDEDMYAYQPTDEVRTTGEMLAHIANAQFMFCSIAAGGENPSTDNFEESATTKDEILAALASSFEYCGGVYDGMTDEAGAEMRDVFGMQMAASAVLAFNSAHNYEHYGNLVTYMRINDIVPPSSQ